jgi:hypothetical protein
MVPTKPMMMKLSLPILTACSQYIYCLYGNHEWGPEVSKYAQIYDSHSRFTKTLK